MKQAKADAWVGNLIHEEIYHTIGFQVANRESFSNSCTWD